MFNIKLRKKQVIEVFSVLGTVGNFFCENKTLTP